MSKKETTATATIDDSEVTSLSSRRDLTDNGLVTCINDTKKLYGVRLNRDLQPLFVELIKRFADAKAEGKPFLDYTDFKKFCPEVVGYSEKQVRNIANGDPTGKTEKQKAIDAAKRETNRKTKASESAMTMRRKTNEEILAAAEEIEAAKTAEQKTQEYAEAYAAPKIEAAVKPLETQIAKLQAVVDQGAKIAANKTKAAIATEDLVALVRKNVKSDGTASVATVKKIYALVEKIYFYNTGKAAA
jgi:hypothetical protein